MVLLLALAAGSPPDTLTVVSQRGERQVPVVTERGFPAVAAARLGPVLSIESSLRSPGALTLRLTGRAFEFVLDAGYFRFGEQVYTLAAGPYLARDSVFLPLQFLADALPRLLGERYRYDAARTRLEELAPQPTVSASSAAPAPSSSPPASSGPVASRAAPAPVRAAPAAPRRRIIAIDAGHGGVDPGMSGPIGSPAFLREKDVTLAVARALAQELQSRGFGTVMVRDADTLIDLFDRGRIAARGGADVFVSIHVNSVPGRDRASAQARGFETYYLAEARTEDARRVERMENASVRFETTVRAERGDPLGFILRDLAQNEHLRESSRLAELIQGGLGQVHPSESRGVKQAGLIVLSTTYMPAVLVEVGFGTNPAEARYLTSAAGQRRLAQAIAEGVGRYIGEYERRVAAGSP